MAGSMKDIKLRIKSVESTMQITKAMEAGGFLQNAPCQGAGGTQPTLF